ncbi:glucose dehydrogenase [Rhizobium sp. BK176]|nr:glucose dehydrogenase [Rhizobium sp. BK399]MCS3739179.1 glucose dehydrogenase [Rhizobium sp. BK661]MCS4090496.1 glucose dehydrogenase [Rhizobium sp. BK176]
MGLTLLDQLACRIDFHRYKYEGCYTPPSLVGSIIYPGNFGTFNWGSLVVDPERQIMFGMQTYLAFASRLVPAVPRRRARMRRAANRASTATTALPTACSWDRSSDR